MISQYGLTLDSHLEKQIRKEQESGSMYLNMLQQLCPLAKHGLIFRGRNEKFGSPHNGKFLGLKELIAKSDPSLADHIKQYGSSGSEKPS
jgi:hypothetical protein